MIHAATLLHDDVIDSGSTRRFLPTANNIWGANQAVLLGRLSFEQCVPRSVKLRQKRY
jgi:octaprenyl-diphosphate synthase